MDEKTDLEKFLELYQSFGINLHALEESSGGGYSVVLDDSQFEGYAGFCSAVYFDAKGKFVSQGFWE